MRISYVIATILIWVSPSVVHAADMPDATDHPDLPRVAGSEIMGYAFSEYDAGNFMIVDDNRKVVPANPEGSRTRILYIAPPGDSPLKIQKNYDVAFNELGKVTEVYACRMKACSNHLLSTTLWSADAVIPTHEISHPNYLLGFAHNHTNPTYRYVEVDNSESSYHIGIFSGILADNNSNATLRGRTFALLEIIEVDSFEATLEFVDASQMRSEITAAGHVALYGISFDHDQATMQPGSDATIAEIAKVLNGSPDMQLYVVGHTDDVGALQYNQDLSQRRAHTVVKALTANGISQERLTPLGAGPMAPIGSNDTDDGRALNRRVELVKRAN